MASEPLHIESYGDDDHTLYEICDLLAEDLIELEQSLTLTAKELSPKFRGLLAMLRRRISSLDSRKAS